MTRARCLTAASVPVFQPTRRCLGTVYWWSVLTLRFGPRRRCRGPHPVGHVELLFPVREPTAFDPSTSSRAFVCTQSVTLCNTERGEHVLCCRQYIATNQTGIRLVRRANRRTSQYGWHCIYCHHRVLGVAAGHAWDPTVDSQRVYAAQHLRPAALLACAKRVARDRRPDLYVFQRHFCSPDRACATNYFGKLVCHTRANHCHCCHDDFQL